MKDPYGSGMFKENPYYMKSDIQGQLVAVLRGVYEERGLELIKPISRCVKTHEIHELIASDEPDIGAGSTVNRIAYLGFMEILNGGVITIGDGLFWIPQRARFSQRRFRHRAKFREYGESIGFIAGFDETHMPNHLNIVVRCDKRITGEQFGFRPGDGIMIRQTKE